MEIKKNVSVCPITASLEVLGGKWKVLVLARLAEHPLLRFGELHRLIPKVSQKMLTQQLRELEEAGLVARRIYAEVPPRVEYRLTPHGQTLQPVLSALRDWGDLHRQALGLPARRGKCSPTLKQETGPALTEA